MLWSQFFIKKLGGHFGSCVLDNSNCGKISHSFKKNQYFEQSTTLLGMKKKKLKNEIKKKNCKPNTFIKTNINQ